MSQRDYPNLTLGSALGLWDVGFAVAGGVIAGAIAWFLRRKNTVNSGSNRLFRIVVAVLPALFVVSALATLVLTLSTYNGDWVDARQGLATAFAALIAAVGVVVSVAVSYQTGEENRLAQQENLRRQLEHQREIEDERAQREQNKQDAEIIKSLNDRLHEILSRRYSKSENQQSASYFQLAALYQDWETLAASSEIVRKQKNSQQRNILKILFGVPRKEGGTIICHRKEQEVRTLNSIIRDIFPETTGDFEEVSASKDSGRAEQKSVFDLSYLDLGKLSFAGRSLAAAHLQHVHLQRADLQGADLREADLRGAYLWFADLKGVYLWLADLRGAYLSYADLQGADLREANLQGAYLREANLQGAKLWGARLQGANLEGADLRGADLRFFYLENASFLGADDDIQDQKNREKVINQLRKAKYLPSGDELLNAKDFDQALADAIIQAHEEYHKDDQQ
ncbi:pentapeptide repeat-containing protein [Rothia sp. P5764]|uniref:pentapeptide repeat-containing protein n=1 Tax=Rothia sp. P5764 TaxID=3402654 RepID=UPI003ACC9A71